MFIRYDTSTMLLRNLRSEFAIALSDLKQIDDKYKVHTVREGNDIIVYTKYYNKTISMNDSLIDRLFGVTWESKVRKAQKDAFQTTYQKIREEENLNYSIEKLKQ